jgi:hypothetical protein
MIGVGIAFIIVGITSLVCSSDNKYGDFVTAPATM